MIVKVRCSPDVRRVTETVYGARPRENVRIAFFFVLTT